MPTKIAAVIPALDNHAITKRCVDSLAAGGASMPLNVIIVDDGSSTPYASENFAGAECLRNERPIGYTRATNRGIEFARAHYAPEVILLLNNDIEFRGRALDRLAESLAAFDVVGPYARSVCLEGCSPTSFLEFSCVLVKTAVFDSVGLLDPIFQQGYYSDDDFCLRCEVAGVRLGQIAHANPADILHYVSSTHGAARWQRMEEAYEVFLRKWGASEDERVRRYIRERLWNPHTRSFGRQAEVETQRRVEAAVRAGQAERGG